MQNFARSGKLAIDKLMWNFAVLKEDNKSPDAPEKGAYIHGMFMQGARWDDANMVVGDSAPKVLWTTVPIIWYCSLESFADTVCITLDEFSLRPQC